MLIERIVAVGVGQCGANIVAELESFNFNCFYVNTSLEDLDTINTAKENKYHIKGGKGMAKDRKLATECILANNNAENICYAINDQYSMADIIYFFYSTSGGTGGTMGNFIAEQMADLFPEKTINVVAVLPKSNEDIGIQANAIESLNHLKALLDSKAVTQIHLLDNNSRDDIFSINKDFAICLNRFVSFNEINKTGNLDENEKEKLLIFPGLAVILEFSSEDFGKGLTEAMENTFYAEWFKNFKLRGWILNNKQNTDINKQLIRDVLGMVEFTHETAWDEDSNVLVSVGSKFNDNILNKMKKNALDIVEKKKQIEEESKKEIIEDVAFDSLAIISDMGGRKKAVSLQSGTSSRRRGENKASSVLDKYRKM